MYLKKRVKLFLFQVHISYYRMLVSVVKDKFEVVDTKWDLIVVSEREYEGIRSQYPNDKMLVFASETILGKYIHLHRRISQIVRKFNLYNTFLRSFALKFQVLRNSHYQMLQKRLSDKNTYFMLTEDIKRGNVLRLPFFLQDCYDCQEQFLKKDDGVFERKHKFCAFINSHLVVERELFFTKLSKYKRVDSYAGPSKNTDLPNDIAQKYRISDKSHSEEHFEYDYSKINRELFKDYKFVICFENSFIDDYITEKLPNVMLGNSIGIYRGASNVGEFFNTKSFINYDEYGSDEAVIEKIIELDKDDEKYRAMLNEPYFKDGVVPKRFKNAKKDLEEFIDMILST